MPRLNPRTASHERSIWLHIPEESFRQHLVDLEKRTNAVPIEPSAFPLEDHNPTRDRILPVHVEQQLADDLAFLAAIEEGAQSVAAACLEEHLQPPRLTVRFAALDLSLSDGVKTALEGMADVLTPAITGDVTPHIEHLVEQIVRLHFRRLLARLRSNKWEKPKYLSKQHKKPLWQDFTNLLHRVQFLYTKREAAARRSVEKQIQHLAGLYEGFETPATGSPEEFSALVGLIKESYEFCLAGDVKDFARRLEDSVNTTPTAKVASAIKCLRQIEKIGAYWRIAVSLVQTSQNYPALFQEKLQFAYLTPYEGIPTTIGYEAWATTCHVHAEVQLAVHYDLQYQKASSLCAGTDKCLPHVQEEQPPSFHRPRVIGTSKWLCYLCYLFLQSHGSFVPANTHGRLYDQWTVPDLAEYGDEMRARYRDIVQAMDAKIEEELDSSSIPDAEPGIVRWRAEPMTSRQNLLCLEADAQS